MTLITGPGFRRRTHLADPVIPRRPRLDRINTEADFESRLSRMDSSPERSMAPPMEGRRSITTNSMLGEHSGGSTPRSLPTPQLSVASGRSKTIAENFAHYTQAVLHTATKTIHHDSVKRRLEKQAMEADRWRKHYHGFGTMAEEQTRQLRKSEALLARSDDSLRKSSEVQERAIEGMASSMVTAGHGKPMPVVELDTRSKHSDKEVAMFRDELNDTRKRLDTALNDTKRRLDTALQDIARFNDKVSFQRSRLEDQIQELSREYVTKETMTAAESKISEATLNISKLQASSVKQTEGNDMYTTIVNQVNQFKEDICKLSANVSANKVAGQKLKEDIESQAKDFEELKTSVTEQMKSFEQLNDYVTGNENPEEKSLTDIVQEGAAKTAKHAEALQTLNNELGELDNLKEESKDLGVRVARLETGSPKESLASLNHQASSTGLEGEVAILKEEVKRIVGEQQMKDDIVGEEVDQLRNLLNVKNGEVEQLRNLLDSQVVTLTGVNDQILQLQSHQITAGPSQNEEFKQLRNLIDSQGVVIKEMNDQLLKLHSHQRTAGPSQNEELKQLRNLIDSQGVAIKETNGELLELRSHQQTAGSTQIEGFEQLRKTVNSQGFAIKEMNDQVMKLHSQRAVEASQTAPKPSAQVNVLQAPDDLIRLRIKELETSLQQFTTSAWEKISNTEVFVASQEQRFNNLTTEHMARSMVSQLEKMYPNHPGNVLNELRHVKASQQALENLLRSLETRLAEVCNFLGPSNFILAQNSTIPDLQIAIRKTSDRIERVAQMHQDSSSGLNDVKDLLKDQSSKIEGVKADLNTMKKDHLSAVDTSKSDIQAIKADIKAMETTLKANIEDIESAVEVSKTNFQTIKAEVKDIAETTINECFNIHDEITTLSEQINKKPSTSSDSKKDSDLPPSSPPSKYITTASMRKHKKDNRGGGDEHTPSPSSIPRSIGKHKKENLKPPTTSVDGDSDTSLLSPSSRQRAGSERSAASAAKVRLANEARAMREANEAAAAADLGLAMKEGKSNGSVNGGTPTRKSGRKRGRGGVSDGDESDYHPMKKLGRPD